MRHIIRALVILLFCHSAWAELKDENLLQTIPSGFKVGFQAQRGSMIMMEFVPEKESVENWTEMLTTQVFLGLTRPTPVEVRQTMQQLWSLSCPGSRFADVDRGVDQGYVYEVWLKAIR